MSDRALLNRQANWRLGLLLVTVVVFLYAVSLVVVLTGN